MIEKTFLQRCEESGRIAFECDRAASACTFAKGSDARKAWSKGWRSAAKTAGFKLKGR
jgi:ribosome modulation factor